MQLQLGKLLWVRLILDAYSLPDTLTALVFSLIRLCYYFPRVRSVSLAKSRLFSQLVYEPQLVSYIETQSRS